jgi:dsDNA-specific endonuclease/ATPase MutS2
MHPGALKALEFDRILAALRRLALTSLGDTRLAELRPSGDARQVASLLGATTEAVRFVGEGGVFALDAPPDLDQALTGLAVEGRALEPNSYSASRASLSIDATRNTIRRA